MDALDKEIYKYIEGGSDNYLGRTLRDIESKFVRKTKGPFDSDIWAALSRLSQAKKIEKSGSHRHKAYKALAVNNNILTSW